ncbi:MAG: type I polyketide synthase [Rivularia sp. (in: Bacteria)]|nr:type I polyketide synthase [Rivularia sp. MS3]
MEPIAVIGIGCRFPKAANPQSFWQLLRHGGEGVVPIPRERWDVDTYYNPNPGTPGKMNVRWGAFLDNVDKFDADFFGMSPEEVEHTDPQQRLFLEVAWEALENAGIVPNCLAGSQTGVFTGICTIDYHRLLYKNFDSIGPYSSTGTTFCITANRLSYLLDLRGPSMAVDTACSSSLVTIHLACQSLRNGESNMCLAGGVNLILSPDSTISSSQTRMLSTQGRCNTFDAKADGYVRGEGCGVVVLKRLSDAIENGDNILALVRGSAVNQDGLSNSLTAPNGLAQQAVIRQALANAGVQPADISYVNTHAVGTSIGDAIEFKALKAVLNRGREANQTCWVGSVKPNIGHLEAASGMSALIGVILSLQNQEIPPHLHLEELNPYVSLENTPFAIPTKLQKWCRGDKSRLAGVSAFGFGGTNAHIVIEEAPKSGLFKKDQPTDKLHCMILSAKTDSALKQLAQRYAGYLESQPKVSLASICFNANTRRTFFKKRLCLIVNSKQQLQQHLSSFVNQIEDSEVIKGEVKGRKKPKLLFVFPSEEFQYMRMGYQLYQTQSAFRSAFDECGEIYQSRFKESLIKVLDSSKDELENRADYSDCVLFAVEYALAKLWLSWGIKPKAVMGFGVGEYVAAKIAGILKLEDALKLVIERSRLLETGVNSEEILSQEVDKISFSQPKIPVIVNNNRKFQEIATAKYWKNHLPAKDKMAVESDALANYHICLSVGVETTALKFDGIHLSSLCQGNEWGQILRSLGELIVRGTMINWNEFYQNYYSPVQLPTYPFERQRYWFKTAKDTSEDATDLQEKTQEKLFSLLHQSEVKHLTELLENTGAFSPEQIKILPQILETLAKNHQAEISTVKNLVK